MVIYEIKPYCTGVYPLGSQNPPRTDPLCIPWSTVQNVFLVSTLNLPLQLICRLSTFHLALWWTAWLPAPNHLSVGTRGWVLLKAFPSPSWRSPSSSASPPGAGAPSPFLSGWPPAERPICRELFCKLEWGFESERSWVAVWDNSSLCSNVKFLDAFRKAALSPSKRQLEITALPFLVERLSGKPLN